MTTTNRCDLANSSKMVVGANTIHSLCPGVYKDTDGKLHACGCDCHHDDTRTLDDRALGKPLETIAATPLETKKPPEASARPKTTTKIGLPCECGCGTLCKPGSRFKPGCDAKLKSMLMKQAVDGSAEAWAEIVQRGWTHVVKSDRVHEGVRYTGSSLAATDPTLTANRIAVRRTQL